MSANSASRAVASLNDLASMLRIAQRAAQRLEQDLVGDAPVLNSIVGQLQVLRKDVEHLRAKADRTSAGSGSPDDTIRSSVLLL